MRFFAILLLLTATVRSQDYPQDFFRSPLDIPLQLAGNFGEPRSNHFHAGFDFRTQQKEGFNVYAAADGFVSRIKISSYGYGKAIYITHPNGYTTVYGHLQRASGKIQDYIKANQYKSEAYEIEVMPGPQDLVVKKGDLIAISGNTGGSEGPHLHFEIRDTKTEKVINPLYFGFGSLLPDGRRPVISNVTVYPIDETSAVNGSAQPISLDLKAQADGTFLAEKVSASGRIGFGVSGYDMDSNSMNRNGIFSYSSFINGNPSFQYKFDTFHFDETRYVNAAIDYPRFKRSGQRVLELFMKYRYPLSIIHTDETNGVLDVKPNVSGAYRIEAADYNGNKCVINIPVEYSPSVATNLSAVQKTPYYIDVTKDYNFEKDNISVFFPAGSFYDNFYLDFNVRDTTLILDNKDVPVHTAYTITMKDLKNLTEAVRKQTFIATLDGKRPGYNSTTYKDGNFIAKVKALGTFGLAMDTIPPKIAIAKSVEGKWISSSRFLQLTMSDDLSGIKEYKGYLNGKFILFEYEYKTRKLTHDFADDIYVDGRNELKVIVTDNVGNSSIFETYFFKSKK